MSSPVSPSSHFHAPHVQEPSDVVGQVLSAVCAVHCVSTPLLLSLLPAAGSVLGGAHPVLFFGVVGVAVWAFVRGYRRHHRSEAALLALVGISLLGVAAFLFHHHPLADTGLSLLGAAFMMGAHMRNRTLLLRAEHQHD